MMSNSITPHSKELRAASAKAAMRKRLSNPNYKQISIGGNSEVIERFIAALDGTGEVGRINQLKVVLDKLEEL